ncbi:MAG: hypothetical protein DRG50_03140 [Deltaproteobacteria bacterium]|nr:MAG: hypothetical protein DRG50_03140 [Deltaproteobacteria bacterium]
MTKRTCIYLILFSFFLIASCAKVTYIGKLLWGETKILWGSMPIQEVLGDKGVKDRVKKRIRLVQEVKEFAHQKMGLSLNGCYESFYRVKDDTLIYLVSACPKDSLRPYSWHFPIVGEVTYKGFFDKKDALKEIKRLQKRGLDTCLQRAIAFSTLGWLSDPIYSTILERHPVIIINTIIHELVHNNIFFKGKTEFNEQIASFIGEKGALMFIEEKFGVSSPYYQLALDLAKDEQLVASFLEELYDELKDLYSQQIPLQEKMRRRQQLFAQGKRKFADLKSMLKTGCFMDLDREGFNNASIVAYKRYLITPDGLLQQVYEALNSNMKDFIKFLRSIRKEKAPHLYLERWLRERPRPTCY